MSGVKKERTSLTLSVLALAIMTAVAVFGAWTHQLLWGWFLTPVIGIAAPSIAVLFGLRCLIVSVWPATNTISDLADKTLDELEKDNKEPMSKVMRGTIRLFLVAFFYAFMYTFIAVEGYVAYLLGGGG